MPNYIQRVQILKSRLETSGTGGDRKARLEEVVLCFLKADFERKNTAYGVLPSQIDELENLEWPDLKARICGNPHFLASPVSHRTMEEKDGCSVEQWFFIKDVPLKDCWTNRINRCLEEVVAKVKGNLCRLAKSKDPKARKEFQNRNMPPANKKTLIGLLQKRSDRQGKIQIIDGAHRLVAMCENRVRKTNMYLGNLTAEAHREESHRKKRSWDPKLRKPPKHDF